MKILVRAAFASLLAITSTFCLGQGNSEQMPQLRRDQALNMLKEAKETVKKEYYDPTFHGFDLDSRMTEADKRIRASKNFSEALGVVAWTLDGLNDSHTFFIPPSRPFDIQNGWEMSFIGNNCYIIAVQDGSDAAAKGIKPGDQVLAIEGYRPNRQDLWKLRYAFNVLAPRSGMHLTVVSPNGQPRQVEVKSSVHQLLNSVELDSNNIWDLVRRYENLEQESRLRWVENGKVVTVQMPDFTGDNSIMDKVVSLARDHDAMILDLRGNPGGRIDALTHLLGGLMDHEVKVGDQVGRKDKKPLIAKSRGDHAFTGKLVVLIDSRSASCSEVFARTVQLEKRGTVIGDLSSGSVMEARIFPHSAGVSGDFEYAFNVTVSDLIMTDGKSLEHVGVTPDMLVLPTAEDLAASRDPVIAKAFETLGEKMAPESAGKFFPTI